MSVRHAEQKAALELFNEAYGAHAAGDLEHAIELYSAASRKGFTPAQTNLGNIYDDVLDPPRPDLAVKMYRRAVQLGDSAGAWCLAIHYRNRGNLRWYDYWLRRAAEMGDEDAISALRSSSADLK